MHWKLKVSGYGKIKSAEIEVRPLTLFVGDNNSGKSYLMSLLWGIQNFGVEGLLGRDIWKAKGTSIVADWIKKQALKAWRQGNHTVGVSEIADQLQSVLQEGLNYNKDKLVERIFNSRDVRLKELQIELIGLEKVFLDCVKQETGGVSIEINYEKGDRFFLPDSFLEKMDKPEDSVRDLVLTYTTFSLIMGIPVDEENGVVNRNIYFPAARTGFMLTKDIINKVGRNTVFNLVGTESREISPFTRPINQFLDVMNDLTLDGRGDDALIPIVEYLENGMAEGNIEISPLPNKEVSYVPSGQKKGLPLRVVSAVVTELSPLILILKYREYLDMLFYEEPEMCLHPQLQRKMGKVICQLVNAGVGMLITTHSDIILQYINNMISLSEREDAESICGQLGYTANDLLNRDQIKVYQLKSAPRRKTTVEELECGKNGFVIPTFNDALDRIMDEGYAIQE